MVFFSEAAVELALLDQRGLLGYSMASEEAGLSDEKSPFTTRRLKTKVRLNDGRR